MRKNFTHIEKEHERFKHPIFKNYGNDQNGCFRIRSPFDNCMMTVIASSDGVWEHVSVSKINRIPTWKEMCFIKDLFFRKDETVVQFHPKKTEYKNLHKYCLHLWRNKKGHELPPKEYV